MQRFFKIYTPWVYDNSFMAKAKQSAGVVEDVIDLCDSSDTDSGGEQFPRLQHGCPDHIKECFDATATVIQNKIAKKKATTIAKLKSKPGTSSC